MEPKNTFVIPHLNNQKGLLRCLETLYKHTPDNFRVILVDQSNDESLYSKVKDKIHLHIKAKTNLGFAKACNTGIRVADTEYVTLLNDDVEFIHKKWWDGIMETFNRYDTAVAVNPGSLRKLDAGGIPRDHKDFPYKKDWTEEEYDAMVAEEGGHRPQGTIVDGITPWCTTVHRKGFLEIGLFDESYWPGGGEDYDMQNRSYLKGNTGKVKRYRWLGTSLSQAWHWWCTTKVTQDAYKVFHEATTLYKRKWGIPLDEKCRCGTDNCNKENPYPNGQHGKTLENLEFPEYVIKNL